MKLELPPLLLPMHNKPTDWDIRVLNYDENILVKMGRKYCHFFLNILCKSHIFTDIKMCKFLISYKKYNWSDNCIDQETWSCYWWGKKNYIYY